MKSILDIDKEFKSVYRHHTLKFDVYEPNSYWNHKTYTFSAEFCGGELYGADFKTKEEAKEAYDIMVECDNKILEAIEEAKKKISKVAKKIR